MALLCCLLSTGLFAQDMKDRIIYLDSLERLANEDNYVILRIFKNFYTNSPQCEVYDYYKSGKLRMAGTLKDKYDRIKQGTFVNYYENGNKESIMSYEDDAPVGKFYSWYEKGDKEIVGEFLKIKSEKKPFMKIHQYWSRIGIQRVVDGKGKFHDEDLSSTSDGELNEGFKDGEWFGTDYVDRTTFVEKYKLGRLLSGVSTDTLKVNHPYTEIFTEANPKRGKKHFINYLREEIVKPFEADWNRPRGRLVLEFEVDKNGWINNVKVIQGLGFGLDEEAVRRLRNYDQWNPATKRGMSFGYVFTIPLMIYSP